MESDDEIYQSAEEEESQMQENEEEQEFIQRQVESQSYFDNLQLNTLMNQEFEINEDKNPQTISQQKSESDQEDLEEEKDVVDMKDLSDQVNLDDEFSKRRKAQTVWQKREGPEPSMRDAKFGPFSQYEKQNVKALPEKSGSIQRKAHSKLLGYLERYLELKNKVLKYYRNKNDLKAAGIINFDFVSIQMFVLGYNHPNEFIIKPTGAKRIFQFKCKNTQELNEWMIALYHNWKASKGFSQELSQVVKQNDFYRFDRISNDQFQEQAESGDILLFRGKNAGAKFLRVATQSKYDHVALILRDVKDKVFLFEATGSAGVDLLSWEFFVHKNWHLIYHYLAHRKLYTTRDKNFHDTVQAFVHTVWGQKYKLTAGKLFRRKSAIAKEEGFFCSELVASMYKKLGLLPSNVSACQYWPGRFSQSKNLKLEKEAYLGPEMLIQFD